MIILGFFSEFQAYGSARHYGCSHQAAVVSKPAATKGDFAREQRKYYLMTGAIT